MGRKKVLLIDDDEDLNEANRLALETGYDVTVAKSGEEGWKHLEEEAPAVIVLDVMMDHKAEGFIFSRKLKKDERFSNIPVLMITGMREQTGFFPLTKDPRDPQFLPVEQFLEKPVKPEDLLRKVDEILA